MVVAKKGEKFGYMDKKGKVVVPIIYDYGKTFSQGLVAVQKNGKRGYIDKTGKTVIPFIYDYASNFFNVDKDNNSTFPHGNVH